MSLAARPKLAARGEGAAQVSLQRQAAEHRREHARDEEEQRGTRELLWSHLEEHTADAVADKRRAEVAAGAGAGAGAIAVAVAGAGGGGSLHDVLAGSGGGAASHVLAASRLGARLAISGRKAPVEAMGPPGEDEMTILGVRMMGEVREICDSQCTCNTSTP